MGGMHERSNHALMVSVMMTCMRLRLSGRKGLDPIGYLNEEASTACDLTLLISFSSYLCLFYCTFKYGVLLTAFCFGPKSLVIAHAFIPVLTVIARELYLIFRNRISS